MKAEDPIQKIWSGAVYGLRKFVKRCKKAEVKATKFANSPPPPMIFYEELRRSRRGSTSPTTTAMLIHDFTGLPPQGARVWTKESIAWLVDNFITSGQPCRPFLLKIIGKGKTRYKDVLSIYKMYRKWKKTGAFRLVGGQATLSIDQLQIGTKQVLKAK